MAFQIIRNDIVKVEADAIVNTANPLVTVGEGVDQAIYTAAGWDRLIAEREKIGVMEPGDVAHTPAYDLNAEYIIHAIGPAWRGGDYGERETVAMCYRKSLALADELGCESIAFPLMATGTYGFPKDEALRIAVAEISTFLLSHDMEVLLVVYDRESFEVSGKLFDGIKAYIDEEEATYVPNWHRRRRRLREYLQRQELDHVSSVKPATLIDDEAEEPEEPESSTQSAVALYSDMATADESVPLDAAAECSDEELEELAAPDESVMLSMDATLSVDMEDEEIGSGVAYRKERLNGSAALHKAAARPLRERLAHMDKTFQEYLFMLIDRKGLKDSEVYKKANIDRRLFSKIRSNIEYKPSKMTAVALAIALELNIDQTRDLLMRAGFALSGSDKFDRIIEYCIETGEYDIYEINCILFDYDQPLLGA